MAVLPLLCLGVAVLLLVRDRETGLHEILGLHARVERARVRVAQLEERRSGLVREIEGLNGDELEIERAARLSLGLVRPGEIVVRVPDESGRR